eukprot:CAMPEP_0202895392 /NCGR_PEP_ID=MMETSP1392-20130828/4608_1 /ASSEMBLY_ACC=CAM_ASM_000868 /TAXON_ID=225041 /ORGANISM="Chlamydomonas chlamydogama, Strain SAG 11-48b" /LENGTH=615 /DNA_ID=CAMNT_0049580395 /DNA_START=300 /DNA_END=2147 /DNA_ORIENTATION=-
MPRDDQVLGQSWSWLLPRFRHSSFSPAIDGSQQPVLTRQLRFIAPIYPNPPLPPRPPPRPSPDPPLLPPFPSPPPSSESSSDNGLTGQQIGLIIGLILAAAFFISLMIGYKLYERHQKKKAKAEHDATAAAAAGDQAGQALEAAKPKAAGSVDAQAPTEIALTASAHSAAPPAAAPSPTGSVTRQSPTGGAGSKSGYGIKPSTSKGSATGMDTSTLVFDNAIATTATATGAAAAEIQPADDDLSETAKQALANKTPLESAAVAAAAAAGSSTSPRGSDLSPVGKDPAAAGSSTTSVTNAMYHPLRGRYQPGSASGSSPVAAGGAVPSSAAAAAESDSDQDFRKGAAIVSGDAASNAMPTPTSTTSGVTPQVPPAPSSQGTAAAVAVAGAGTAAAAADAGTSAGSRKEPEEREEGLVGEDDNDSISYGPSLQEDDKAANISLPFPPTMTRSSQPTTAVSEGAVAGAAGQLAVAGAAAAAVTGVAVAAHSTSVDAGKPGHHGDATVAEADAGVAAATAATAATADTAGEKAATVTSVATTPNDDSSPGFVRRPSTQLSTQSVLDTVKTLNARAASAAALVADSPRSGAPSATQKAAKPVVMPPELTNMKSARKNSPP